ncbi:MAG: gas vesicle protein GvpJ [Isosphaerales bacterium]
MSIQTHHGAAHSIHSATLADVLERVLDKGLVIAGDIKIKLVDIELLTIQIRLVVASVEKAREMGMDWWTTNPDFQSKVGTTTAQAELTELKQRLERLEAHTSPELISATPSSTSQVCSPPANSPVSSDY